MLGSNYSGTIGSLEAGHYVTSRASPLAMLGILDNDGVRRFDLTPEKHG
jgi:hypothetical protein